jgi:pentatricopeptide repeat protein
VSLLSYDVQKGKMDICQAEEVFVELMDTSVAHAPIVQREIANQMIRACCLTGNTAMAMDVVSEMAAKGIRRTHVTYAPIFRVLRANEDAEGHIRFKQFVRETEGGPVAKLVFIDIPRLYYGFVVFCRFNWFVISSVSIVLLAGFVTSYTMSRG